MSKNKFNWKSLFINEENGSQKKTNPTKEPITNFPKSELKSSKAPTPINNSVMDTVLKMYESGFDSLNMPGYDFYEFFKAIKAVNSQDASIYKMAFSMAQGVDSSISKSKLLSQADFYTKEIEKVHKKYKSQGVLKKAQINTSEKNNKSLLIKEINDLEKQLIEIQNNISKKKKQLASVDNNMLSKISEIEQKIVANDLAKETILNNIKNVVDGININL